MNYRDKRPRMIMHGHADGELWGLATHPTQPIFITASDDKSIRTWNMKTCDLIEMAVLESAARSAAFSADGEEVAIGLKGGKFLIVSTKDLTIMSEIHHKPRKETIHELKYSPNNKYLAVGSNDGFVDIYDANDSYRRIGECKGATSHVTHIDFDESSKYIQVNTGARERFIFEVPSGVLVTDEETSARIVWVSWTSVLGPEVDGIWGKYTEADDINACQGARGVVVTGDDFGKVKLFRFPCTKRGTKFREYTGHSHHVTNVRFSADETRIITTGGEDNSIFQWRFFESGLDGSDSTLPISAANEHFDEESDSDNSDVDEVDSDIERETVSEYERSEAKEKEAAVLKSRQASSDIGAPSSRSAAPTTGVSIEYVHGYRGYDCRNNLFFTNEGQIVYHVAAVGILMDLESRTQQHYTGHTDDILCLAMHPSGSIVATGQIGRVPVIHVWDTTTRKTLSILKNGHERGVCAVDFSRDGRRLASVGVDNEHCIAVWDWSKGTLLATARGHKDKVFVIGWSLSQPDSLVTGGVRHIKFWKIAGSGFTSKRGIFGKKGKSDSMLCIAFTEDGDTLSGACNGQAYRWRGNTLISTVKCHTGPLYSIFAISNLYLTGGKDGSIAMWDSAFEACIKRYDINPSTVAAQSPPLSREVPAIRAVAAKHNEAGSVEVGTIIAGTTSGDIFEVNIEGIVTVHSQGHGEGEVWGLAAHPTSNVFVSGGDDGTIRIWDTTTHQMLNFHKTGTKDKKQGIRAIAISPTGKVIACGTKDGRVMVYQHGLQITELMTWNHRKEEISDLKFSPDGKYLAVGSHDQVVDIYDVNAKKRVGVCKGASSYITHVDWDERGKLLMVNSGAKEILFYEAPRGKRQPINNEVMQVR